MHQLPDITFMITNTLELVTRHKPSLVRSIIFIHIDSYEIFIQAMRGYGIIGPMRT